MSYLKGLENLNTHLNKKEKSFKQKDKFVPFVQSPNSLDDIPSGNIQTAGRLIGKRIRGTKTSLLLQLSKYAIETAVKFGNMENIEFRKFYDFMKELYKKEMKILK